MVEDKPDNDEITDARLPPWRNRRVLLIGGGIAALVLASILGTLSLLGVIGGSDDNGDEVESEEVAEGEESATPAASGAVYFPIRPPLVVNFQARGRQRFMQASITLLARDHEAIAAAQTHLPLIRNELIMLFSGQVYSELQTDAGREALREQALASVQKIMQQEIGRPGVEQLFFTNLVMQ